jgi:hypothetical protein
MCELAVPSETKGEKLCAEHGIAPAPLRYNMHTSRQLRKLHRKVF